MDVNAEEVMQRISRGTSPWQELLEEYRASMKPSYAKGKGLFHIAQHLLSSPLAASHRQLAVELLEESIAVLKDGSSTSVRVPIVATLVRQLALGKQRERSEAAHYIIWLKLIARSSSDKAQKQAQRAVDILQKEFPFLQDN